MSKIGPRHLERKAFVYVRQSSMAQVQQHRESAKRQYARFLAELAFETGALVSESEDATWRVHQAALVTSPQAKAQSDSGDEG